MNKLFRIKPADKKSIYAIYEVYKTLDDGNVKWFNVRELYRWGQGFRELDNPVYLDDDILYIDTNLGWGCDLDDLINVDFEYSENFTDSEKKAIEDIWFNGDPEDPDLRSGAAWLFDYSDWEIEDDYVEILGPFTVDIIDGDTGNVVEEDVKLTNRPPPFESKEWPFKQPN